MAQLGSSPIATDSFEEYIAARSRALYRTAYLLSGQRVDAEDLLQTTLIKLFVGWRHASKADSPDAYARRVMLNTFISGRRPQRFRRERLVASPVEPTAIHPPPNVRGDLWPLVLALPPRQRAVVVLRFYEDLSEREIADVLNIAPGTVKSTAAAAMKSLRQRLSQEGES